MSTLLTIHSLVRWIVVIFSVVCLVTFAVVWLRKMKTETDRIMMTIFTGLFDLQVLLGLVYLIWVSIAAGSIVPSFIGHGVTMLIAAAVAHSSMRWRKSESPVRARNNLITLVVVLVLVFIGVAMLQISGVWTSI